MDNLLLLIIICFGVFSFYKYKELSYKYKRLIYENTKIKESIKSLNSDLSITLKTLDKEFTSIKNSLNASSSLPNLLTSLTLQPNDIFNRVIAPQQPEPEPEQEIEQEQDIEQEQEQEIELDLESEQQDIRELNNIFMDNMYSKYALD